MTVHRLPRLDDDPLIPDPILQAKLHEAEAYLLHLRGYLHGRRDPEISLAAAERLLRAAGEIERRVRGRAERRAEYEMDRAEALAAGALQ